MDWDSHLPSRTVPAQVLECFALAPTSRGDPLGRPGYSRHEILPLRAEPGDSPPVRTRIVHPYRTPPPPRVPRRPPTAPSAPWRPAPYIASPRCLRFPSTPH